MSWQLASFGLLALVLAGGGIWYERTRPPARLVALVAALAALAAAGRLVLAPLPNVVATTDIALLTGYALGPAPGFAVGALAGLVSNIWLGQGPWTPWQMAGWGIVGIGGALLARLTLRRAGRLVLAIAAGVAGLAYGALLDLSVMVTYGGEQSIDRYLALSARGIPFNVAHAAGNAAIIWAAGPAIVRMLDRYRMRSKLIWHRGAAPAARARASVLAGPALLLALSMALAAPAALADPGAKAAAWLRAQQAADGGFGSGPGSASSPGMTAWAMLGFEAAGINPRGVRSGGRDPVSYLRKRAGQISSATDLERTILALETAGVSSRSFAGRDLIAELLGRRRGDGSWEGGVNPTAFGALALRVAGAGDRAAASLGWLRRAQNRDGGWGFDRGVASDPDSTGAALQALAGAGAAATLRGAGYLRGMQRGDGGFPAQPGLLSNSQSTAWAIQGLVAAGVDPRRVRKRSASPLDYLRARQAGNGHVRYSTASDQTPVWVTAQAIMGLERAALPLAELPWSPRRRAVKSAGRSGGSGGPDADGGGGGGGASAPSDTGQSHGGARAAAGSGSNRRAEGARARRRASRGATKERGGNRRQRRGEQRSDADARKGRVVITAPAGEQSAGAAPAGAAAAAWVSGEGPAEWLVALLALGAVAAVFAAAPARRRLRHR